MGAFSSTEACELPDLTIDVELAEGATLPIFDTPGRGGLTLCAREDTILMPGVKTHVPTGVVIHLPFMLVGLVTGIEHDQVDTNTKVIDFDTSTEIVVSMTLRDNMEGTQEAVLISRGEKIGSMVILPVARPGICVVRTVTKTAEEPSDDADADADSDVDAGADAGADASEHNTLPMDNTCFVKSPGIP